MKVQTLSVVIGGQACNARCPFCVANMTPENGVGEGLPIKHKRFNKALRLATMSGVNTVLLTGKGEPTLWPELITKHLEIIDDHDIPIVELQTNGLRLYQNQQAPYWLDRWGDLGLTTVAISVVHYKAEKNREIYTPNQPYMDLERLIQVLHTYGLSVRLSLMMMRGYIDSIEKVKEMAEWCHERKVEQLTIRGISHPTKTADHKTEDWVEDHKLGPFAIPNMREALQKEGTELLTLGHGATVYDYKGQNVCLTDCLTLSKREDSLRQIIYFPDGHLRYDWQYEGAIIF